MPYYRTANREPRADSFRQTVGGATEGGVTFPRKTLELGYRSSAPSGDDVMEVALSVAEPYLWYLDANRFKQRTLIESGELDTTLIKKDRGHTWFLEEAQASGFASFSASYRGTQHNTIHGFPYQDGGGISMFSGLPATDLENRAALQYGRMAPLVSEFSLGTFIGELREGLPRLVPDMIRKAHQMRSVGSDYLNLEFGWKPLLDDIQGLATALTAASAGLFRPLSSSHRRREIKPIEEFTRFDGLRNNVSVATGDFLGLQNFPMTSLPTGSSFPYITASAQTTRKITTKRWFEGEFVFIPKAGFNPKSYLDRLETLMSMDITPSVLWNLAPWSWLVDWSNDIGSAISSMEAASTNRILTSYYYGMEDVTMVTKSAQVLVQASSGAIYTGPSYMQSKIERRRRRRVRGNPYGFTGTTSSSLNGDQWAILGALGMSKLL
jgi:hypothetical protein